MQIQLLKNEERSINAAGEVTLQSRWRLAAGSTEDADAFAAAVTTWCGEIGDPWRRPASAAGNSCVTTETAVTTGVAVAWPSCRVAEVTFTGIPADASGITFSGVTSITDTADLSQLWIGRWRVTTAALSTFLTAHPLHGSATAWAGSGCYHYRILRLRESPAAVIMEIHARRASATPELIDARPHELLLSHAPYGYESIRRWIGRWRVSAAGATAFANLTGTSAAAWSEQNFLVYKVTPKWISGGELEYTVEARSASDIPSDVKNSSHAFSNRQEQHTEIVGYSLSRAQAGYLYRYNGQLILDPNWRSSDCPFVFSSRPDPRLLQQPIPILRVSISTYQSGSLSDRFNAIHSDFISGGRLYTGSIAGVSGCWLKNDCRVREVFDDSGSRWCRITKVYDRPLIGHNWNSAYWAIHN